MINEKLIYLEKIFFLINKKKIQFLLLIIFFLIHSISELIGIGVIVWYSSIILSEKPYLPINIDFLHSISLDYLTLGYMIIFIFIIKFFINLLNTFLITKYCLNIELDLKKKILHTLSKFKYLEFISKNSSYYSNQFIFVSSQFANGVLLNFLNLISNLIITIGIIIFLLFINFKLTIYFASFFILVYALTYFLTKNKIQIIGMIINENNKIILKNLKEMLLDFKSSYINDNFDFFINKLSKLVLSSNNKILIKRILLSLPKYIFELLIVFIFIGLLIFSKINLIETNLIITIITFGFAALRLIPSINAMNVSLMELKFANRPTDELYNFINLFKKIQKNQKKLFKINNFVKIDFRGVGFKYKPEDSSYVLNNVNFTINNGDFVGIIGDSGSGKTTLLNLISTLLEPTLGKININDLNYQDVDLNHYTNLIAYISQEKSIIDDTIKNNIIFNSKDEFSEKRFLDAINKSKVNNFVKNFSDGYDTMMGDNGAFFSGGQAQRIILARCLYSQKEIYILDEATGALDEETEKQIFKDMQDNLSSKTIIAVTHNSGLKKYFNKILNIKNGSLI